jgi:hypothetical protein
MLLNVVDSFASSELLLRLHWSYKHAERVQCQRTELELHTAPITAMVRRQTAVLQR